MNPEWVVTGMILLGGMTAGGISLYLKRRRESQIDSFEEFKLDLDKNVQDKK